METTNFAYTETLSFGGPFTQRLFSDANSRLEMDIHAFEKSEHYDVRTALPPQRDRHAILSGLLSLFRA